MKTIIALIGKAGAGKDTVARVLAERNPDWNMIVSCTTRPMREGEQEGVNYYYLTNEEFALKVLNGDMLEATCFNGWHYGTMASSLKEGINIGVFNPEGYDCLTSEPLGDDIEVRGYYIMCRDKTRMLRQLNREEKPNVAEICRRFFADEEDFRGEDIAQLPYLNPVFNDLEEDIQRIVEYIESEPQDIGALFDK